MRIELFIALAFLAHVETGATAEPERPTAQRTPKVAALDYSADHSIERQAHLSRFGLVIISSWYGMQPGKLGAFVQGIKAHRPGVLVAHYSILSEATDVNPALVAVLDREDWWLRNSKGARVQWTSAYTAWEVNITDWARADAQGNRWPQWKAAYDTERKFGPVPAIDYVFSDTVMAQNVTADWKRNGRDQKPTDGDVRSATVRGHAAYWDRLRELNPRIKVMANATPEFLESPEIKVRVEGAFLEGTMGRRYSPEASVAGWTKLMDRYRRALKSTRAPADVIFQIYADESDLQLVRFGLATAMLDDGYFAMSPQTPRRASPWYDEFSAPIGVALDPPPNAPAQNGIWIRRYSHGLVAVNPGNEPATADIGEGYRRIRGTQDPAVNDGSTERLVRLRPREGRLMLKL